MSTSRALAILADLQGSQDHQDNVHRLCVACAAALSVPAVAVSVAGRDTAVPSLVGASSPAARKIEDIQFSNGEGPSLEAMSRRRLVLVSDLALEGPPRWVGFTSDALEQGIQSVFAFPLQVGGLLMGVFTLYRDRAGGLSGEKMTEALAYVDATLRILLHLQDGLPLDALHPEIRSGVNAHAGVHQATGMVSVQAHVGIAEALSLLRAAAFAASCALDEVAADVVSKKRRFQPQGGLE